MRDNATLLDIAEAGRAINQFTNDLSSSEFVHDRMTQAAVSCQLVWLGVAIGRLSPEFRSVHSAIPWDRFSDMEERLVVHYDDINLEWLWATAANDVPAFVAAVEPLLPTPIP